MRRDKDRDSYRKSSSHSKSSYPSSYLKTDLKFDSKYDTRYEKHQSSRHSSSRHDDKYTSHYNKDSRTSKSRERSSYLEKRKPNLQDDLSVSKHKKLKEDTIVKKVNVKWVTQEKLSTVRYFNKNDEPFGSLLNEDEMNEMKDKIIQDMIDQANNYENSKINNEMAVRKNDEKWMQQKLNNMTETLTWTKPRKVDIGEVSRKINSERNVSKEKVSH